jgi:hypothetical protein
MLGGRVSVRLRHGDRERLSHIAVAEWNPGSDLLREGAEIIIAVMSDEQEDAARREGLPASSRYRGKPCGSRPGTSTR